MLEHDDNYPRPQLRRDKWIPLDGLWQYAITDNESCTDKYDGNINVPYSPECINSGVNRALKVGEYIHYTRDFVINTQFINDITLLHFGAVDMFCKCYLNNQYVGAHQGGFNAFTLDISYYVHEGSNNIKVVAWDDIDSSYYTNSKQRNNRGGIWYSNSSGIWQSVWCESVPTNYVQNIKITPDYDNATVCVEVIGEQLGRISVTVMDNGIIKCSGECLDNRIVLPMDQFTSWSPDTPYLYELCIESDNDKVNSYFGMRKFSIMQDNKGYARICLNNQPYFMNGLLDQGYWADGMLTGTDTQLKQDIMFAKSLGFNTLRKHIKVEPMRWYYYCDTIGMIVWQDMPSGGTKHNPFVTMYLPFLGISLKDSQYKLMGRADTRSRSSYYEEYTQMINQLYNVVSIACWVPFNEGWGQFDATNVYEYTCRIDSTRLIDHASGWHDQGCGDFKSLHIYYRKIAFKHDSRPIVLSEFGGYSLPTHGHMYSNKQFGYKLFISQEQFTLAYCNLYESQIIPLIDKGLCACIYTQLSDVEEEINGLITYDRQVCKVDKQIIKQLNGRVKYGN
ncbi:MAG: glycoside hydrolase family 2 TIM barrel-domain containing protein [Clostridia bacterium]|nr:glycoside hydrolase family 2 TIM barrel-domain containing protein [Clostridia bacterium]